MDGADGSTSFIDSSGSPKLFTANGTAQIDTAQSMFGGASGLFNGTGNYVSSNSVDVGFTMGTGDFTVEGWCLSSTLGRALLDLRAVGTPGFFFGTNASGFLQAFCNSGSSVTINGLTTVCDGTWHSFAFSRVSGVMYIFRDGLLEISGAMANNHNNTGRAFVGAANNNTVVWVGHIDELRITKGVGRYSSNYTPSGPFPNS
jgi:hypothetical protein